MKSKYPVRAVNETGDKTIDVQVLVVPDSAITAGSGAVNLATATGDVTGPSSSTDNAIARFDSTTGKVIQNSAVTVSDAGLVAGATVSTAAANTNNTGLASTAFVQGQGQGYLVYDATLTQTSTNAPTATVGQNNIGQTMTWAYVSPGVYTVTAGAAAFTANKTQVFIGQVGTVEQIAVARRTSTTVITVETGELDTNTNGLLTETAIRIVIFP